MPLLLKLFKKMENDGTLLNVVYEDIITLPSTKTRKRQYQKKEYYSPIFLMNIEAKILDKI